MLTRSARTTTRPPPSPRSLPTYRLTDLLLTTYSGAHHTPSVIDPMIRGVMQVCTRTPPCTPLHRLAPSLHTLAHPCTPLHTPAHPCTPLHTLAHPSQVFKELTKKEPRYKSEGGTHAEDVALQNIQAAHAPSHPRTLAPSHPHAWVCAALHPLTHHACRTHPPPHAPPPVARPARAWC